MGRHGGFAQIVGLLFIAGNSFIFDAALQGEEIVENQRSPPAGVCSSQTQIHRLCVHDHVDYRHHGFPTGSQWGRLFFWIQMAFCPAARPPS